MNERGIKRNIQGAIGDVFRALPPGLLELIGSEVEFGGETMDFMDAMREGYCPKSEDGQHCEAWWDCEPCHFCGYDVVDSPDCSCPRHSPELYDKEGELIR